MKFSHASVLLASLVNSPGFTSGFHLRSSVVNTESLEDNKNDPTIQFVTSKEHSGRKLTFDFCFWYLKLLAKFGKEDIHGICDELDPTSPVTSGPTSAPTSNPTPSPTSSPTGSPTGSPSEQCLPPSTNREDAGYNDEYRGWYDVQGCGKCNDYCRWVGGVGTCGNPNSVLTCGTTDASYWSCRPAGTDRKNEDLRSNPNFSWDSSLIKCDGEGADAPTGSRR